MRWEMLAAVCEPRLAAVAFKAGRISLDDRADCRALLDLFKADVLEALVTDGLISPGVPISQSLAEALEAAARPTVARWLRAQALAIITSCVLLTKSGEWRMYKPGSKRVIHA